MAKTITTKILLRNDTRTNWSTNNPTLGKGEMGVETDTNKFKFGDGSTAWNSLPYATTPVSTATGSVSGIVLLSDAIDSTAAAASGGTAATPAAVKAVNDRVDSIISTGGEPNQINGISLSDSGTVLPVSTVGSTTLVATIPLANATSGSETDGLMSHEEKAKLAGIAAGAQPGTVTSVQIQATSPVQSSTSTAQSSTLSTTISLANGYGDTKNPYAAKNANKVLAGPASGADAAPSFRALVADDIPSIASSKISDFATAVDGRIDTKVASVFTYKGTVAAVANLPSSGNKTGDVYHVTADGNEYVWNGSAWESLGANNNLVSIEFTPDGSGGTTNAITIDSSDHTVSASDFSTFLGLGSAAWKGVKNDTTNYATSTSLTTAAAAADYISDNYLANTDQLILDCGSSSTNLTQNS